MELGWLSLNVVAADISIVISAVLLSVLTFDKKCESSWTFCWHIVDFLSDINRQKMWQRSFTYWDLIKCIDNFHKKDIIFSHMSWLVRQFLLNELKHFQHFHLFCVWMAAHSVLCLSWKYVHLWILKTTSVFVLLPKNLFQKLFVTCHVFQKLLYQA